jgi:hypothetical protein
MPTNLAARLAAQADGGEIVLSESTRERLGDGPPVEDLRLRELKNVDGPVRLYRPRGRKGPDANGSGRGGTRQNRRSAEGHGRESTAGGRQVDRARYEAELARRRYMQVDPDNRLVADALEAEWNNRLRALATAQEEYERRRAADPVAFDAELQAQILALARDFPRLWRDPSTPDRERKRMARLILEDVTLIKGTEVAVHVRFKAGTTRSLTLPRAKASWEERQTRQEVVSLIDRLLDEHTDGEAAAILNARGLVSGTGKPFSGDRVATIRRAYRLKDRGTRLREAGMLSLDEVAESLGVNTWVIKSRGLRGQLPIGSHRLDDQGQHMYERPAPGASLRCPRPPARADEVQNA